MPLWLSRAKSSSRGWSVKDMPTMMPNVWFAVAEFQVQQQAAEPRRSRWRRCMISSVKENADPGGCCGGRTEMMRPKSWL
jgi:hypothetical protein